MWVKICGWNDPAVVRESLALSIPDAIGLNFYKKSPRAVNWLQARDVCRQLPASVETVGVFVNHTPTEIRKVIRDVGLTHIQLHGDESPDIVALLKDLSIIRAFRLAKPSLDLIKQDLQALSFRGIRPWAYLVDAWHATDYGGTGQVAPWSVLTEWKPEWPRLILAGGLTPENVVEACGIVKPFGVDTASGVESERGRKSPELVHKFIEAARSITLS